MGFFTKFIEKRQTKREQKEKQAIELISTMKNTIKQEFDVYITPLNDHNKKGDEQLDRILKETQLSKESGDLNNLIKVYEDILLKEGLCFNGKGYYINLAELYLKNGQNDKAWGYLIKLGTGNKHHDIMDKIKYVQSKILKKEKKYVDALIFQLAALFYELDKGLKPTDKKIESTLYGLVKKCKLESKYDSIKSLLYSSTSEIDLRNNFKQLLTKE